MMRQLSLLLSLSLFGCGPGDDSGTSPQGPGGPAGGADDSASDTSDTSDTFGADAPAAFSYVGNAALQALREGHLDEQNETWARSIDATFPEDWLLHIPDPSLWGQPVADIQATPTSNDPSLGTNEDFGLPRCAPETGCAAGECREVQATITAVGDAPEHLCVGASDFVWDEMYEVLASATEYADVSSLDFPDNFVGMDDVEQGRFLIAMRNALRYLDSTGAPVQVRFMFGWLINDLDWDEMLRKRFKALVDGVPEDTALQIWVGGMNYRLLSWNHSKIIAADGERLITGGINFYSADYLSDYDEDGLAPVQDTSIKLEGQPARDGHRYLDEIWGAFKQNYPYTYTSYLTSGVSTVLAARPKTNKPPAASPAEAPNPADDRADGVPVVSMGRLGLIRQREGIVDPSPSDDGMIAAIEAARESLWFSLQDLGPVKEGVIVNVPGWGIVDASYGWPDDLFRLLAQKAIDGVEVSVVISAEETGVYSYGWTREEALSNWVDAIEADADLNDAAIEAAGSAAGLVCDRISLANPRVNDTDDAWQNGQPMGNHAKVWIVDGRAFYVGSQNLYLSNLFEWGLLVDDKDLTEELIADYWDPLWSYSARTAVSGPGVDREDCAIADQIP